MKCQIALLVVCLAVVVKATPIIHGDAHRMVIYDPTGNTVVGGGDENRDALPDAADTNRDGKPDAVVYHHPVAVPAYHVPVYGHALPYHGAGYFPYHQGTYFPFAAHLH